jgi:hypothetical protein
LVDAAGVFLTSFAAFARASAQDESDDEYRHNGLEPLDRHGHFVAFCCLAYLPVVKVALY